MTPYPMNFVLPGGLETQLRDQLIDVLEDNTFEEIVDQGVEQILNWKVHENPQLRRIFELLSRIHSQDELKEIVTHHLRRLLGTRILSGETGRDNAFSGGDVGVTIGIAVGIGFAIAGIALLLDYLQDPGGWECEWFRSGSQ